MASARIAFLAISMVLLSSVAMATDFTVGNDKGWTIDFNYTDWAKDKVFHVGDNLVFNYNTDKHNVFKVNGTVFKDCAIPPPNLALATGKDVVPLSEEGRHWFICGKSDHCANHSMKFVISAVNASAPSAAHALVSSGYGVVMAAMLTVAAIFV